VGVYNENSAGRCRLVVVVVWLATSTNPVGNNFFLRTRHLHAHAREAISAAYLVCTAGAALFTCAQPLLLPSPSEGLTRWLKSRSTLRNTKGAHPNSHLHFIGVHRAVIQTQKAAQNRLKKRRGTTTTHHAIGSRHRDDVARWNEAFCSLFSSVFFSKLNKQCIKQRFIQDHLLF
jgi:hypothetical protein